MILLHLSLLLLSQLTRAALATGLHSGIPVHQRDLGDPAFQSAENGWTAPLADGHGFVRIYVGRDEVEAADWFQRTRESFSRLIPDYVFADLAAGDGLGVLMFRDGNVAVMVRSEDGAALTLAESLRARIIDSVPPLAHPTLQRVDDGWGLIAPGSVFTQVRGGGSVGCGNMNPGVLPQAELGPPPITPCQWVIRPDEVTIWDAYGRPTVVR